MNAATAALLKEHCITSVMYDRKDDLRTGVLAENVVIRQSPNSDGIVEVEFDFLCSKCGKRHWATEVDDKDGLFSTVGWTLKCGWVFVADALGVDTRTRFKVCLRKEGQMTKPELMQIFERVGPTKRSRSNCGERSASHSAAACL